MDYNTDITAVIKNIPHFLDLSPHQLEMISNISSLIEIDPGDIPIHEGAKLDYLYILLEGEIKVEVFIPGSINYLASAACVFLLISNLVECRKLLRLADRRDIEERMAKERELQSRKKENA